MVTEKFACPCCGYKTFREQPNGSYTHSDGEHSYWTSDNWFYIDKKGRKVKLPSLKK